MHNFLGLGIGIGRFVLILVCFYFIVKLAVKKGIKEYGLQNVKLVIVEVPKALDWFREEDYIKNDERLSEKRKELNPLEWTKLMNNYKNMAEEIVLNEYVFV